MTNWWSSPQSDAFPFDFPHDSQSNPSETNTIMFVSLSFPINPEMKTRRPVSVLLNSQGFVSRPVFLNVWPSDHLEHHSPGCLFETWFLRTHTDLLNQILADCFQKNFTRHLKNTARDLGKLKSTSVLPVSS